MLAAAVLAVAAHDQPAITTRWIARAPLALALTALLAASIAGLWRAIGRDPDLNPFLLALGAAAIALAGLVSVVAPDVVPFRVDIWRAAAPESAQKFFLAGVVIVMPVILAYTAFAYWTFRGKIERGAA